MGKRKNRPRGGIVQGKNLVSDGMAQSSQKVVIKGEYTMREILKY
jgi:hypothetical protein